MKNISRKSRSILLMVVVAVSWGAAIGQTGHFIPSERFSSGMINDLCQDSYGYLWIATEYGLDRYDGYRFVEFQHQPDDTTSIGSSNAIGLFCDRDGQLWVGTSRGLDRYDYGSGHFVHYPFVRRLHPRVTKMVQLRDGRLLVATSGYRGLYCVQEGEVVDFEDAAPNMPFVNSVMEDSHGRLWQCSFGDEFSMRDDEGFHRMTSSLGFVVDFAERNGEVLIICLHGIHRYANGQLSVADIDMSVLQHPDAVIRRAYTDHAGNLYIGTRGDGLYRLPAHSRTLERVVASADGLNLATTKIWAITEDRQRNLWLGCQSKGLVQLPDRRAQFSSWSFAAQGNDLASAITSVCEGDSGRVWCSVQGNGIYGFMSDGRLIAHPSAPANVECIYRTRQGQYWVGTDHALFAYDPHTGRAERRASFDCDKINAMADDGHGKLFISTFSQGFWTYDTQSGALTHYNSPDFGLSNNWVMGMMTDADGCVWMATSSGVSCFDPATCQFPLMVLEDVLCFSLCQTRLGDILIGTEQGLYRLPSANRTEPEFLGLGSKTVGYIVEASGDDVWCATSKGIWQCDLEARSFIGHVNGNGLTASEYLYGVGMMANDGRVCFATNNGLTVFRPSEVTCIRTVLPDVKLTGFYVAGNSMGTSADRYAISYLDNSIQMEFSLLDYNNPGNVVFEHRINGGAWQQNPEGQNSLQLNHLQPGDYTVEVRALSAGACSPVSAITIGVTPPWYRSSWAYFAYSMAAVVLVGLIGLAWKRRANRRLDEAKMRFLINATHDIRSPLTLIMGAVKKLKVAPDASAIDAIDRNAQRLLQLVNQILDERRIDKKQLMLHCRETDMVAFINGICKLYRFTADQRGIRFVFDYPQPTSPFPRSTQPTAWVDRIQFDKVVSNLLSNAFKYTPDGGTVTVTLRDFEQRIEILVADSGIGIKDENPDRLFDRFYQGRNAGDVGMQGTGIGLNLSRAITLMHGGQIRAANNPDGTGALFTVTLPKGNRHLKPEQIVADAPARTVFSSSSSTSADGKIPTSRYRILIADDEREIADYIIAELGNRYRFDHAPNGKEALKMLLTTAQPYDLVISDVMMPEMDGLTLLRRIKENPQISQLPVIMLTSKAEVEHKIAGLKSGADAYIGKPFDMEELHIQIDNLIDNVRRLRGKFSGAVSQEERVENVSLRGNDDVLMERVMQSVNAHLSDPNFSVDVLADEVGLSRAQLHRKMKEMTGIATGQFVRNLRMEQAARLLREEKVNISQVAYSVGYADQAHFSAVFKSHFGQTPSEFIRRS